VGSDVGVKILN